MCENELSKDAACKEFSGGSFLAAYTFVECFAIYKCPFCRNDFQELGELRNHSCRNASRFPFMCVKCNKFFDNGRDLSWHSIVHTGDKLLECFYCRKKFDLKGLKTHYLSNDDGKTYRCGVCHIDFKIQCVLDNHITSHRIKSASFSKGISIYEADFRNHNLQAENMANPLNAQDRVCSSEQLILPVPPKIVGSSLYPQDIIFNSLRRLNQSVESSEIQAIIKSYREVRVFQSQLGTVPENVQIDLSRFPRAFRHNSLTIEIPEQPNVHRASQSLVNNPFSTATQLLDVSIYTSNKPEIAVTDSRARSNNLLCIKTQDQIQPMEGKQDVGLRYPHPVWYRSDESTNANDKYIILNQESPLFIHQPQSIKSDQDQREIRSLQTNSRIASRHPQAVKNYQDQTEISINPMVLKPHTVGHHPQADTQHQGQLHSSQTFQITEKEIDKRINFPRALRSRFQPVSQQPQTSDSEQHQILMHNNPQALQSSLHIIAHPPQITEKAIDQSDTIPKVLQSGSQTVSHQPLATNCEQRQMLMHNNPQTLQSNFQMVVHPPQIIEKDQAPRLANPRAFQSGSQTVAHHQTVEDEQCRNVFNRPQNFLSHSQFSGTPQIIGSQLPTNMPVIFLRPPFITFCPPATGNRREHGSVRNTGVLPLYQTQILRPLSCTVEIQSQSAEMQQQHSSMSNVGILPLQQAQFVPQLPNIAENQSNQNTSYLPILFHPQYATYEPEIVVHQPQQSELPNDYNV